MGEWIPDRVRNDRVSELITVWVIEPATLRRGLVCGGGLGFDGVEGEDGERGEDDDGEPGDDFVLEVGVGEDEGEEVLSDEEFAGEGGDEASAGAEAGEEEGGGGVFWFTGGEEGQSEEEHNHVDDGVGEAEVFFADGFLPFGLLELMTPQQRS